jgi:hypothetical protein
VKERRERADAPEPVANGFDGGADGDGHGADATTARRLLGADREAAFAAGCAPALATALRVNVTRVLGAERMAQYLNLLYALLLRRRSHEIEPRHDDLYALVLGPQRRLGGTYDPQEYAHDLDQLAEWGAVERITEAQRLRGYKDNRRVQYRYRATEDAVALLEWLETRLADRIEGRVKDSRDRLADVVALLKEARRLLDDWRRGDCDGEQARRVYYLIEAMADAVTGISEELVGFRAEMLAFSQRPYDIAALREILRWLERYVELYIRRVGELRIEVRDRVQGLRAPRYLRALVECHAVVEKERAHAPRFVRASGPLRPVDDLLEGADRFFRHRGRLADLCHNIDESARSVVLKMHRHIRELERRNARLDDLRATRRVLAAQPAEIDVTGYVGYLVASAHGQFDVRAGSLGHRVAPPTPRRHQLADERRADACPLPSKRAGPAEVRVLRAKALAELAAWLEVRVLAGRARVRLAETDLAGGEELRRWMDVARARHLAGGKSVAPLGVVIEDTGDRVRLGDDPCGLDAPDCAIEQSPRERNGRQP